MHLLGKAASEWGDEHSLGATRSGELVHSSPCFHFNFYLFLLFRFSQWQRGNTAWWLRSGKPTSCRWAEKGQAVVYRWSQLSRRRWEGASQPWTCYYEGLYSGLSCQPWWKARDTNACLRCRHQEVGTPKRSKIGGAGPGYEPGGVWPCRGASWSGVWPWICLFVLYHESSSLRGRCVTKTKILAEINRTI